MRVVFGMLKTALNEEILKWIWEFLLTVMPKIRILCVMYIYLPENRTLLIIWWRLCVYSLAIKPHYAYICSLLEEKKDLLDEKWPFNKTDFKFINWLRAHGDQAAVLEELRFNRMPEFNEDPPFNAEFLRKHVIKSNSFPYQAKLNQFSKRMGRAQSAMSKAKKRPYSGKLQSPLCREEWGIHQSSWDAWRCALQAERKILQKIVSCHSGEQLRWKKKWFYWTKMIVKVQRKENAVCCGADGIDESLALLKIYKQFFFLNEYHSVRLGDCQAVASSYTHFSGSQFSVDTRDKY